MFILSLIFKHTNFCSLCGRTCEFHNLALQNGEFVKAVEYVGKSLELGNFHFRMNK